jgi:hypothetical protein
MRRHCASIACFLLLVGMCLMSGCATVSGQQDSASATNQNSPWLDPDAAADFDEMTTAQKVTYCLWWPVLEVGEAFCGHAH